jgi:hypothetical protein
MKLSIITPALVAVLGFALASAPATVQAQTTNAAGATPAPAAAPAPAVATKTKTAYTPYKGTISAIDATSVTVTTAKGDVKLVIDATTKFAISKKPAKVTDFAVGDKVTGSYSTGADGTLTAHSLHKKAAAK